MIQLQKETIIKQNISYGIIKCYLRQIVKMDLEGR